MRRKKQETAQDKFWKKTGKFLEKVIFNKKIFYSVLSGIVIALTLIIIFVVRHENQHEEVKKLYAEAFFKYREIQSETMDKLNQDRAGLAIMALEKVDETGYSFPENYLAKYDLASIYLSLNKTDLALPYLESLKAAPKKFFIRGKALIELGKLYQNQENFDQALAIYNGIISDYTNFYKDMAYYHRGMLYEFQGKIDLAISSYKLVNKDSAYGMDAERNIDLIEKAKRLKD